MKLREDLTLRKIGNEYMIVEPGQDMVDMSTVYTLNESAAWLWNELIGQDFTVQNIVELLLDNYDVEIDKATEDAEKLVEIFVQQGILKD